VLPAAFGIVRAELPETFFAVDNVAVVDIGEPFDNQVLNLVGGVCLAKISCHDVMAAF
jgi:hypothetical protein